VNSKRVLKIAGNILAIAGILGGYAYARSKFRCPKCGSWKSTPKTREGVQTGTDLAGLYLTDPIQVIKTVRTCQNGHEFITSTRIK
jgi:hypothetical protein